MTLTWDAATLDCHGGPEVLALYLILAAVGDGSVTPTLSVIDTTSIETWTDTMPEPPANAVNFYDVEAQDAAGNDSTMACS